MRAFLLSCYQISQVLPEWFSLQNRFLTKNIWCLALVFFSGLMDAFSSFQKYQMLKVHSSAFIGTRPYLQGTSLTPVYIPFSHPHQGSAEGQWPGTYLEDLLRSRSPCRIDWLRLQVQSYCQLFPFPVLPSSLTQDLAPENTLPINVLHTNPCIRVYFYRTWTETSCDMQGIL